MNNFLKFSQIFREAQEQTGIDKLLAPSSQAPWQKVYRIFTCTPLSLNPRPFVNPGSQKAPLSTIKAFYVLQNGPWTANSARQALRG